MPASRPPIPLADYQRIFRVLKTVLDVAETNTPHAAVFFSVAGAHLVEQFYKKRCQPVAGAAFYKVEEDTDTVLSFADTEKKHDNLSSAKGFHCWTLCDGYIIDFTAPLFRESLQALEHTKSCPRKMFQKPRELMVDSPLLMRTPGDFYLLPNVALTNELLQDFLALPANTDLVNMCASWYKKPPKDMPKEVSIRGNDGRIANMKLSDVSLTGAW